MRCPWANSSKEMQIYHDTKWCKVSHDERYFFEMLTLELSQAGLSWATILKRRDGYSALFSGFDIDAVAKFDDAKKEQLLKDPRIIRNKLKVNATINNARQIQIMHENNQQFSDYIWSFVDNKQIVNHYKDMSEMPAQTKLSQDISKDLKKRGFRFVGPTIIYSFLQSVGVINDHLDGCDFK